MMEKDTQRTSEDMNEKFVYVIQYKKTVQRARERDREIDR